MRDKDRHLKGLCFAMFYLYHNLLLFFRCDHNTVLAPQPPTQPMTSCVYKIGPYRIILPRNTHLILIAVFLGAVLFYTCNWSFLIQWVMRAEMFVLQENGYEVEVSGNRILANNIVVPINDECTYVDWLLIAMPFALSCSRRFWRSCVIGILVILVWFPLNIARIWVGINLTNRGYNRWVSHDLPDYVLWYLTLALLVIIWAGMNVRVTVDKGNLTPRY
ncbi:MAG: archaeosortase/exosortase family protein [Sedimentisphaerales bacterium]|nr:archaeosortase/exosortase family protein [Sedimentisphaerales bacterium]